LSFPEGVIPGAGGDRIYAVWPETVITKASAIDVLGDRGLTDGADALFSV
jgi:hypothetical protein